MAVSDADITKIVKAIRPIIKEEVQTSEKRLDSKIEIANKKQTEEIVSYIRNVVGDVVDSLDDAYASKKTEENVENMRAHLHATP